MLRLIEVLIFSDETYREPTKTIAAINTDEVTYIEPALWGITRWTEGKHCVWLTLKSGDKVCAFGRPEDFIDD